MKFEEVNFSHDDKKLFSIDNNVDAIRQTILPKLISITKHTIKLLEQVYSLKVFDLSTRIAPQPTHVLFVRIVTLCCTKEKKC
jgi:hypothetical protein